MRPRLKFGDVIYFTFEMSNGDEKDRPSIVVSAKDNEGGKGQRVAVMAISTKPRRGVDRIMELEPHEKLSAGLSVDTQSWVVLNEVDTFNTVGIDWQRAPNHKDPKTDREKWIMGNLNGMTMRDITREMAAMHELGLPVNIQNRDEPQTSTAQDRAAMNDLAARGNPKPPVAPKKQADPVIDAGSAIERAQAAAKARDEAKSKAPEAGQDIDD